MLMQNLSKINEPRPSHPSSASLTLLTCCHEHKHAQHQMLAVYMTTHVHCLTPPTTTQTVP